MIKNENFNKSEELSQCLDHLNAGQYPIVDDEEIKTLVDVAALAKQSYGQEELPKALIDEVVDKLTNEFQTKKQRKKQTKWKRWLYDGLAGAAAVVLIVGATQFLLPQSGDQQIAENVDEHVEAQKIVAAIDQPNHLMIAESIKPALPQQVKENDSKKVIMPVPNEEVSKNGVSTVLVEIINVPESPKIEEKQVAMLQEERPKELVMRKSVSMAKTSINSLQEEKNVELESKMMMMVLPHQVAQSITRDHTSGEIKQIYYLGNHDDHDEILITQRRSDESKIKSGVAESFTRKTKDGINSVTIQVNKYDITVEGKKTSEELKKIAESLIEIEKTISSKK